MFGFGRLDWLGVIGLLALLSGCASNKVPLTQDEFMAAMGQSNLKVDSLLDKGNQEEAVRLLDDLAKKKPDSKEPWVRMAKIYFDAGNYAQAIVSAEEALQRDRTDRTAKSLRAVSGLRVAAQSLTDLRNDVELKGNTRSDAADLVKVMREILGEDVLVPPAELEARKRREAAAAKRDAAVASARARAKSDGKKSDEASAPGAQQPVSSGSNPFSVFK